MIGSYDTRDYDSSLSDGIWQSLKVSVSLSIFMGLVITNITQQSSLIEFFAYLIGITFYISFFSSAITFLFTIIIGYPTVLILRYFDLDTEINSALSGGIIIFIFLMSVPIGQFIPIYYVFIFWALACGYAFMYGFKKEYKHEKI